MADKELKNTEDKNNVALEAGDAEARIYEVGYHVVPILGEDRLSEEVGALHSFLEKHKASLIAEEWPKRITLAYEIGQTINRERHGFDSAFFGWMKFEADPLVAQELKAFLTANEHILRFLIIKTVRDATPHRRPISAPQSSERVPVSKEAKESVPVSSEELDKEIDKLVVAE